MNLIKKLTLLKKALAKDLSQTKKRKDPFNKFGWKQQKKLPIKLGKLFQQIHQSEQLSTPKSDAHLVIRSSNLQVCEDLLSIHLERSSNYLLKVILEKDFQFLNTLHQAVDLVKD